jgi:tetratricopeptide (TPR) repeat protein
MKMR